MNISKDNKLIGITEHGDAALDLSWVNKLNTVAGAIVITKFPGSPAFRNACVANRDRLIVHATITGNGGTVYEPNVKPWQDSLDDLGRLILAGFPAERIVLRCDPIIPTRPGLLNAYAMLCNFAARDLGITRVRVSIVDNYRHVQDRFREAGLQVLYGGKFAPPEQEVKCTSNMLQAALGSHPEIRIVSCAEPLLAEMSAKLGNKAVEQEGCVSIRDAELLGIDPGNVGINPQHRNGCLCLAAKTELLPRHQGPCPFGCLYCFWRK